jgi:hypothetical protein
MFGFRLRKDQEMEDGKTLKAGTEIVRGSKCPQCGAFYKFALQLTVCNACGWRNPKKTRTQSEVRKYRKKLKKVNKQMDKIEAERKRKTG